MLVFLMPRDDNVGPEVVFAPADPVPLPAWVPEEAWPWSGMVVDGDSWVAMVRDRAAVGVKLFRYLTAGSVVKVRKLSVNTLSGVNKQMVCGLRGMSLAAYDEPSGVVNEGLTDQVQLW